jgi:hypothetical protein
VLLDTHFTPGQIETVEETHMISILIG